MLAVSTFFPRIAQHVSGCSDPSMAIAVVDACIDFCETSMALRQFLPDTTCSVGVFAYTLATSDDEAVSRILSVKIDGGAILPIPLETGAYAAPVENSTPTGYYTTRADSLLLLNLYPPPDDDYTLSVEVALKPKRTATQVQDDLFNLWGEAVCQGALSRLLAVPNTPYSDPAGAGAYKILALSAARHARIEGVVGRVQASRSVAAVPFA